MSLNVVVDPSKITGKMSETTMLLVSDLDLCITLATILGESIDINEAVSKKLKK